jgi:beta-glucosidase
MSGIETRIAELADAMSLEEQVSLLSGADFWSVGPLASQGIGALRVTDGPNGARGGGGLIGGVTAAAFPVGIALGATWDTGLVEEIGRALAGEVRSKGAHVLLAPTVNIQRSVTNGRNFECYSEDAELTSRLAVAYVKGVQSQGVGATIKHFAGNESEIERTTVNSEIGEVALREIYLRPFEAAVKEASVWAVMSGYNKLNGTYAAENKWLLTDVLRGDWRFDGAVMSDWFGSRTCAPTVNAGLDLEMPGPVRDRGAQLVAAVEAGEVAREMVRERVMAVLRLMARVGSLDDHRAHEERAEDRPEVRDLIRRAGVAGTVMLKNEGVLPLSSSMKIAVIGPNSAVAQIMGGGSAQLNPHYAVSPLEGIRAVAAGVTYAPGCTNHRWEPILTGRFTVEWFAGESCTGTPVAVTEMTDLQAFWVPPLPEGLLPDGWSARISGSGIASVPGRYRIGAIATGPFRILVDGALVTDGRYWRRGRTFFEEGCDEVVGEVDLSAGAHEVVVEFTARRGANLQFSALRVGMGLPMGEAEIAEAARVAAAADVAVVCVGRSGEWDTEGSDLEGIRLPGRQDALVAAVLAANPRTVVVLQTGGPVDLPWMAKAPAILQAWYPGQECGNAIADVLFGAEPGGRLAQTFPKRWEDNPTWSQDPEVYPGLAGKVRYEEGVFVGYRHYDRHGIAPMFPFGHGLSYTTWALDGLRVEGDAARVWVTNTGARAGSTVVQVYVGGPEGRPLRWLAGFAKVALEAGEAREVEIALPPRVFAGWDVAAHGWRAEGGAWRVEAGFSVADLPQAVTVTREAWRGAV